MVLNLHSCRYLLFMRLLPYTQTRSRFFRNHAIPSFFFLNLTLIYFFLIDVYFIIYFTTTGIWTILSFFIRLCYFLECLLLFPRYLYYFFRNYITNIISKCFRLTRIWWLPFKTTGSTTKQYLILNWLAIVYKVIVILFFKDIHRSMKMYSMNDEIIFKLRNALTVYVV